MTAVPARAGLVGNPSDLYGGAVLAVPVRAFSARVEIVDAAPPEIAGPAEGRALVEAALARIGVAGRIAVHWSTDIPRSVGLAGSSAIVLATLRALAESDLFTADPLELALLALSIERDDLGIPSGLQDRAAQAFEQSVLVDLRDEFPVVTPLVPARPVRIAIAWSEAAGGDSGAYHHDLRIHGAALDAAMGELGDLARLAALAFEQGDAEALRALMERSAEVRARAAPLSPAHYQLADALILAGLAPNSTGSGGAVAAVITDDSQIDRLASALAPLGAEFVVETYA